MVAGVGGDLVSNSGPSLIVDQRRLLAVMELTVVRNPSGINRVREHPVDMPAREGLATSLSAIRCCSALRPQTEAVGLFFDPAHAAELTI
jgi:hypothetical protein